MKKEDFERYFKNNTIIKFWIKGNKRHPYTGDITRLTDESLVLQEKLKGEITVNYNDILSPVEVIKGDSK